MSKSTESLGNAPHIDDGKFIAMMSVLADIRASVEANGIDQENLAIEITKH